MIYRFLPDPPVNSEQGPISVELDVTGVFAPGQATAYDLKCYLLVGNLRVPCRIEDARPYHHKMIPDPD